MRQYWALGGLLVALVVALAGCGGGDGAATGSVVGYLYRGAGDTWVASPAPRADLTPLAGAEVACAGVPVPPVITAADGAFRLDGVPVGLRELRVRLAGTVGVRWTVWVGAGDSPMVAESRVPAARHRWTVLVYMAADNSLDGEAVADLNEMETVGSTDEVAVVAQCDRLGHGNTLRYEVTRDNDPATVTSPVVANLGEPDMGSAETLRDFLAWGQRQYPAERYLLVLWNHGSGWDPVHRGTRAIAEDLSHNSMISVVDLPKALDGAYPVDIIAMDACLMGMAEVAYEVRTCARYLVAAGDMVPVDGYDYQRVLGAMTEAPGTAPRDMSILLAREAVAAWAGSPYAACASVDLPRMREVATALDGVSARLLDAERYYRAGVVDARATALRMGNNTQDTHVDLYDYLEQVRARTPDAVLHQRIDAAQAAIRRAVIENAVASSRARVHGLAIYLPTRADYTTPGPAANRPAPSTVYPELALARDTRWDAWLRAQP